MVNNRLKVCHINFIVTGLMLIFLYISPVLAQPTSLSDFKRSKMLIQDRIESIAKIDTQIEKDESNVALYKKRSFLNADLLILTEDTADWNIYADRYEADLSKIIKLEKTARNYETRGRFLAMRLNRSTEISVSDLYPNNLYLDTATSDFLEVIEMTDFKHRQIYYSNLNLLYRSRLQKLISALGFPKRKDQVPYEIIEKDFDLSIKYGVLAIGGSPGSDLLRDSKKQLVVTYLSNAEIAEKLGDQTTALKYTQAAQKYLQK